MRRVALLGVLFLMFTACSRDSSPGCIEGETQECLCVGGGSGVQTCNPGGNAWGGCLGCDVPEDAAGDAAGDAATPDAETIAMEDVPPGDARLQDAPPPDAPLPDAPLLDAFPQDSACVPDCDGKECGDDGCGGLCNGCLDIVYDDGSTETAFGYATPPDFDPQRIACVVRFELPQAGMRLTRFSAGWMYGLYNLQIPFELAYIPGDALECEEGTEQSWYNEYCETTPDQLVSIGDFLPLEPYEPMDADLLGDVVLPTKTVYIAAIFDVDEYPIFVCPMDESGDGSLAYMMPQYEKTQGLIVAGASFDKKDGNAGVIPFSIRVEATDGSRE